MDLLVTSYTSSNTLNIDAILIIVVLHLFMVLMREIGFRSFLCLPKETNQARLLIGQGKGHFPVGIFDSQNRCQNFAKNDQVIFGAIRSFLHLFFGKDSLERTIFESFNFNY